MVIVALVVVVTNIVIILSTKKQVYSNAADLPKVDVALVLGTSSRTMEGEQNPFFESRMDKAAELYRMGKVKSILLSGDNQTQYYNEPEMMRQALIERGVPERDITLDYAGLRTLDSVVRSKEIFGVSRAVIVTQRFHSYRALYISNYYGLNMFVLVTDSLGDYSTKHVRIREFFARFKAFLDLHILHTEPKFLGEKESLNH